MFENRYNFVAPDSGPHKLPYTCSFPWFHTPDGQLIAVDVVRSDDLGRRALRVFTSLLVRKNSRRPGNSSM